MLLFQSFDGSLAFRLSPFRSKLPTFRRLPSASTMSPDPSECWREVAQTPGAAIDLCVLAACVCNPLKGRGTKYHELIWPWYVLFRHP